MKLLVVLISLVFGALTAAVASLFNGLLAMLVINPIFHLTLGYWPWVGIAFVVAEMVSSGVALQKSTD